MSAARPICARLCCVWLRSQFALEFGLDFELGKRLEFEFKYEFEGQQLTVSLAESERIGRQTNAA